MSIIADSITGLYNSKTPVLEAPGPVTEPSWRLGCEQTETDDAVFAHPLAASNRGVPVSQDIHKIQRLVALATGITALDLCSARRQPAHTRQLAMWLCRHATAHSLPAIGRAFGGRDHSTVAHAIRRVDERMAADQAFSRIVNELLEDVA